MGVCYFPPQMSIELRDLIVTIFEDLDKNRDLNIDSSEVLSHWIEKYSKVNSKGIFKSIDVDGNKKISSVEFMSFWTRVRRSGVLESEIKQELLKVQSRSSQINLDRFSNPSQVHPI